MINPINILLLVFFAASGFVIANDEKEPLRLGLIGLDTSHVIAFTSRFNEPDNPNHVPGGRVVARF